jgi:hypothetical protein
VQNGILPGRSGPLSAGMNVAFRGDASTVCFVPLRKLQADDCPVPRLKQAAQNLFGRINIRAVLFDHHSPTRLLAQHQ